MDEADRQGVWDFGYRMLHAQVQQLKRLRTMAVRAQERGDFEAEHKYRKDILRFAPGVVAQAQKLMKDAPTGSEEGRLAQTEVSRLEDVLAEEGQNAEAGAESAAEGTGGDGPA